jgi:hypothetical protein
MNTEIPTTEPFDIQAHLLEDYKHLWDNHKIPNPLIDTLLQMLMTPETREKARAWQLIEIDKALDEHLAEHVGDVAIEKAVAELKAKLGLTAN